MAPKVLPEQFIPDHVFVYVEAGKIECYNGYQNQILIPGVCYLFRKNHLVKYNKGTNGSELQLIRVCFEETFLQAYKDKHKVTVVDFNSPDSFIKLDTYELISDYIASLKHIYLQGEIEQAFNEIKQEELLIILLRNQPELAGIFFDFAQPQKINLEEFINRNYRFNLSISRFAYLTGRSLSAFKRDFKKTFGENPNRWLIRKRLQEAHFLILNENRKPKDIYLDLGFEALSHFSVAFKKEFKITPSEVRRPLSNYK